VIPEVASLESSQINIREAEKEPAMPTRDGAPLGSPCWIDLWTSDVEASRRFYEELFGWKAQEPSPEFGGYFMFTRDGVPVAGCMGEMGDLPADNSWKVYLASDDIERTVKSAVSAGAEIMFPTMAVADLGVQSVIVDPTGATVGLWRDLFWLHSSRRARRAELVRVAHTRLCDRRRLLPLRASVGDRRDERHRLVPLHHDA
jgi:predicted enzyme related to lactoylglutathione lyase